MVLLEDPLSLPPPPLEEVLETEDVQDGTVARRLPILTMMILWRMKEGGLLLLGGEGDFNVKYTFLLGFECHVMR